MNIKLVIFFLLILPFIEDLYAQEIDDNDLIYDFVEQMPSFPGSSAAMMKCFSDNTNMSILDSVSLRSRLLISFVVDTLGNVVNTQVIQSIYPTVDDAFIRALQSKSWNPGMHNGKKVPVKISLPITVCFQQR